MTLDDFFKRIQQQYENKLPFVAYRKPNTTKIVALLQNSDDILTVQDFNEQGFVFAPFDNSKGEAILMPLKQSKTIFADSVVAGTEKTYLSAANNNASIAERQQHIELVESGVNEIKNKQFKKVVLSRKEEVTLQERSPIVFLERLLECYIGAFVYCWYHPKIGLWLGATPETLIKIEGRKFSVMSLAGTQGCKGDVDVVWEDKEKNEQRYVTEFITNILDGFSKDIKVSDTQTVKAGNLLHLRTQISGTLNEDIGSFKQLLYRLHPTPAVCGLPKEPSKEFILKNEHYSREFYSGFLGELNMETTVRPRTGKRNVENRAYALNRKHTQLYVNLRCMQIKNKEALIYVGGGITESSIPEREWEETVLKSLVIKSIL
ncbi:chorismate-binding protein [Snuella sedimenti]|uniref:Chorismate-binding protein n=1 Tax=Snuella sedimenti TaxID=2798802 RepID=A0A8J7IG19_9FLAO|nr:chorismate-binding protein [Snuella sedimenti]MBJ6368642.1 chorismate-binding protein [Snuella sedimenti]